MHAFLCQTIPTDIANTRYCYHIFPEISIGIDEIRKGLSFISTLPPQNQKNYLIVHQAEKMTIPAQNAFLKTLEEPPAQSEIYLQTFSPDSLLPTILSRVKIINDKNGRVYTSDSLENSRELFKKLQNGRVGERLAVIDEASFDREAFLHFLDDLEFILHENLSTYTHISSTLYSVITQTRKYLHANCNLRLVVDSFLYFLPLANSAEILSSS